MPGPSSVGREGQVTQFKHDCYGPLLRVCLPKSGGCMGLKVTPKDLCEPSLQALHPPPGASAAKTQQARRMGRKKTVGISVCPPDPHISWWHSWQSAAGEEGGSHHLAWQPPSLFPPSCCASGWLLPRSLLTPSHPPNYTHPHIQRSPLGSSLPKCFPTQGSLSSSSLSTHMSTSEVSSVYFKLL